MRSIVIFALSCLPLCIFAEPLPEEERVFEIRQMIPSGDAKDMKMDNITMYLRMPASWTPEKEKEARKNNRKSVRGLLMLADWGREKEYAKRQVYRSSASRYIYLDFADKMDFAILSIFNFGGYDPTKSADEYSKEELRALNASFEKRLNHWERGFKRMISNYNLPDKNIVVFGQSGGAQIAHRIVLRRPQYFAGIHMHISGSYDTPRPEASKVLWFISTGEADAGYKASERFYHEILKKGYCVIFKAGENFGHTSSPQIENLSIEFFKYLFTFVPDESDPNWKAPPVDKFEMMKYPIYVGDYHNHVVFPFAEAPKHIQRQHMVALPTKPIAQIWGSIIEK